MIVLPFSDPRLYTVYLGASFDNDRLQTTMYVGQGPERASKVRFKACRLNLPATVHLGAARTKLMLSDGPESAVSSQ